MENNFNELKRQMGNARLLISWSCSTLENHRLTCKVMGVGREGGFEEKKFTIVKTYCWGAKMWFFDDRLHRMDGPALETLNGDKCWYVEGREHRVDGPAVERSDGTKEWWVEGRIHRVDGPAIEWEGGDKEWWVNGRRHRLNGPAIEWLNSFGVWCGQWWVDGVKQNK